MCIASLTRTEKIQQVIGVWTTNVYSVDKHQTNRWDQGVGRDHTMHEHLRVEQGGGAHLCALTTVRPPEPSCVTCEVSYMM